jgi:hypothetical protein
VCASTNISDYENHIFHFKLVIMVLKSLCKDMKRFQRLILKAYTVCKNPQNVKMTFSEGFSDLQNFFAKRKIQFGDI